MLEPNQPDARGYFGAYGGRFVPETVMSALHELERAHAEFRADEACRRELDGLLRDFVGRPTPLHFARGITDYAGQRQPCRTARHTIGPYNSRVTTCPPDPIPTPPL